MRNDHCSLRESFNSTPVHWALSYSAIQANLKWKHILKNRIDSGLQIRVLKTLGLNVDNEIEVRVCNETLLKRWGSKLEKAYSNVPVGLALDYTQPPPPLSADTRTMASSDPAVLENKKAEARSSSCDDDKACNSGGAVYYDRRIVFLLQDADHVRRVCDEMDA